MILSNMNMKALEVRCIPSSKSIVRSRKTGGKNGLEWSGSVSQSVYTKMFKSHSSK